MRRLIVGLIVTVLLAGCGVTSTNFILAGPPNSLSFIRESSFLSTVTVPIFFDGAGRPYPVQGTAGTSWAELTGGALSTAATFSGPVVGAALLGRGIQRAVSGIDPSINTTVNPIIVAPAPAP